MQSKAKTVEQYLAELPEDRREAISAVRHVIRKNLPKGYEEGMTYGMIGYYVPHSLYPPGYHCNPEQPLPFASLASQKNHMAVYLACIYSDPAQEAWFREAWTATGKKLDMGKSCVRFKSLDAVPLKVIGQAIKRVPVSKYIQSYEAAIGPRAGSKRAAKTSSTKATPKKKIAKKAAAKTARKTSTRAASRPRA